MSAGFAAVLAAIIGGVIARPKNRADAADRLTAAAMNVVDQLRADNKQLREDLERLKRIVEEQAQEVERCEERYRRLEAILRLRWDLDDDIDITDPDVH